MTDALDVIEGRRAWAVIEADVNAGLKSLPDDSIQTVITSPPYWNLRSYLKKGDAPVTQGDLFGHANGDT